MGLKLGLVPAAPSGFQWWKACKNHNGGRWQSPYLTLPYLTLPYLYVCMYVCMYASIYIYIYIYKMPEHRVPPNLMFIIVFPFKSASGYRTCFGHTQIPYGWLRIPWNLRKKCVFPRQNPVVWWLRWKPWKPPYHYQNFCGPTSKLQGPAERCCQCSWPLALCCGVAWWWFVLGKLRYVGSMGYNEQGMYKNARLDVIMGN